jgi:hypothetical protein
MLAAAVASLVSTHASSSTTASRAVPFHSWNSPPTQAALSSWDGEEQTADVVGSIGRQMHLLPGLLTAEEMAALHAAAVRCQAYDADEPDSVDKAPTFQAHIFEGGEPRLAELAALLAPIIETRLLPYVRAKFGCPDACVADGLLRRYRAEERTSLALHYDVEALATAILPLSVQQGEEEGGGEGSGNGRGDGDPAAAAALGTTTTYSGGLFVQGGPSRGCRRYVRFPRQGDVLVHQFDLMHGVEVGGGTRYAIALWFSDSPASRAAGRAPWVLAAAEAGNADAQFLMATFCAQGRFGTPLDEAAATEWLERGAAQGHAVSQLGLGRHRLGQGDAVAAAASFRAAAEQRHVEAEYSLALFYLDGIGVERSVAQARRWFTAAASQGGEYGEAASLELEELRSL